MTLWKSFPRLSRSTILVVVSLSGVFGLIHLARATQSFSFVAAGDFGGIAPPGTGVNCMNNGVTFGSANQGSCAYQVLHSMGAQSPGFVLALGDLGYHDESPSNWCSSTSTSSYAGIKSIAGISSVVAVAGNHDTSSSGTVSPNYAMDNSPGYAADSLTNQETDGFLDDSTNPSTGISYSGYISTCASLFPSGISWIGSAVKTTYSGVSYQCTTAPILTPSQGSCYMREYYFDYPSPNPIMRFIIIPAGVCGTWFNDSPPTCPGSYSAYSGWAASTSCTSAPPYPSGSEHYCWLKNRIDEAHNFGLWVAVINHMQCASDGDNNCYAQFAPFNLAITDGVDLWLDGHDHDYQRTFQLCSTASGSVSAVNCGAPGATCSGSGIVFTSCGLAGPSPGSPYTGQGLTPFVKGSGMVENIIGTGGGGGGLSIVCGGGTCPYSSPVLFAVGCGNNGNVGLITTNCDTPSGCKTTSPKSCGDVGYMSFSVSQDNIVATWNEVGCASQTCTFSDGYTIKVNNPDFSLYSNPLSLTALRGPGGTASSGVVNLNINLNSFGHFSGPVSLAAIVSSGSPLQCSGGSCPTFSFSPSPVQVNDGSSVSSTLTISTTATTPCGSSAANEVLTITVTGTSGSTSHTSKLYLTVYAKGDVNLDGRVDIVDLVSVANTFGKISGDPSFNPAADLNTDGTINIIDIVIVATNFGASC